MKEEMVGTWRELHNLYASPNIIMVIISRKMRWTGHVANMGYDKCIQNFGQKS